jgi:ribosomal protein S26
MTLYCCKCSKVLDQPGAIVLSAPYERISESGSTDIEASECVVHQVTKFHICIKCWPLLLDWIVKPNDWQ